MQIHSDATSAAFEPRSLWKKRRMSDKYQFDRGRVAPGRLPSCELNASPGRSVRPPCDPSAMPGRPKESVRTVLSVSAAPKSAAPEGQQKKRQHKKRRPGRVWPGRAKRVSQRSLSTSEPIETGNRFGGRTHPDESTVSVCSMKAATVSCRSGIVSGRTYGMWPVRKYS